MWPVRDATGSRAARDAMETEPRELHSAYVLRISHQASIRPTPPPSSVSALDKTKCFSHDDYGGQPTYQTKDFKASLEAAPAMVSATSIGDAADTYEIGVLGEYAHRRRCCISDRGPPDWKGMHHVGRRQTVVTDELQQRREYNASEELRMTLEWTASGPK